MKFTLIIMMAVSLTWCPCFCGFKQFTLHVRRFRIDWFGQSQMENIQDKKIPESSKKQNLILLHSWQLFAQYLHRVCNYELCAYIVLGIISADDLKDTEDVDVVCKFCSILYKGLELPQISVSTGILEPGSPTDRKEWLYVSSAIYRSVFGIFIYCVLPVSFVWNLIVEIQLLRRQMGELQWLSMGRVERSGSMLRAFLVDPGVQWSWACFLHCFCCCLGRFHLHVTLTLQTLSLLLFIRKSCPALFQPHGL